jgi:hypothetical protein
MPKGRMPKARMATSRWLHPRRVAGRRSERFRHAATHHGPAVPAPAFFHHERIGELKSSVNSAILIERTFKMK